MANWIDMLVRAAEERWQQGEALLLAQVPEILEKNGVNLRSIRAGRSLRETIATEAFDKLALIRNPRAELVWAVVPKTATLPIDQATLFKRKTPSELTTPRYKKWFWTAFLKSVPEGYKRYILTHSFSDVPEGEPAPQGAYALEETDIVAINSESELDYAAVQAIILNWASRTSCDLHQFYISTRDQRIKDAEHAPAPVQLAKFAELSEEDQKRIMVPFDIVLKLMRQSQ